MATVLEERSSIAGVLAAIASGDLVLIAIDTVHPLGGRGGSIASDDCAWLVRTLVQRPEQRVAIATRHQSDELMNDQRIAGKPPRVLAAEFIGLLGVRQNVVGWISGLSARPRTVYHGGWRSGFWEASPSALGLGLKEWEAIRGGALRAGMAFPGN